MLEMVLLQLPIVERQTKEEVSLRIYMGVSSELVDSLSMMQEIVGQIVAYVAKDATTEHCIGSMPVPVEDRVREMVEWRRQDQEESGRHNQP